MRARRFHDRPDRARSRGALVTLLAASVALLAGCMTGERPSLSSAPTVAGTMTGDAAIDAVLVRLDAVDGAVFDATYDARYVAMGGPVTPAAVTQAAPTRRSVTIGDVRFLTDAGERRTCRLSSGVCEPGVDGAAVSNTGLTSEFVFGDMAKRLRRDAVARTGATVASTRDVAGRTATCVDVPVTGGTKVYCALDDGVLAAFVGGDVEIDLTSYEPAVAESRFSTSA